MWNAICTVYYSVIDFAITLLKGPKNKQLCRFHQKNGTHTYPACIFSRKKHHCLTIYLCLHVQRLKRDHHLRESLDMLVHAEWLPWHTPLGKDDLIIKMNNKD